MKYYLGLDVGSSASKAVLIDDSYSVVISASLPHDLLNPKPGHFEHDAENVWWGDCCRLTREILRKTGIDPREIKGEHAI